MLNGVRDGEVDLTVRFFDALVDGNQIGEAITLTNQAIDGGIVSVPIYPVDPEVFGGETRYMELEVDGVVVSPRTLVSSVPYAIHARGLDVSDTGMGTVLRLGRALTVKDVWPFGDTVVGMFFNTVADDFVWGLDNGQQGWSLRASDGGSIHKRRLFVASSGNTDGQLVLGGSYSQPFNVGIGTDDPSTELDVAGTTRTRILEITGGGDLAERFTVLPARMPTSAPVLDEIGQPSPGMVVSIDPANPGKLMVSSTAYDTRVAGAISGANGLDAGVILGKGNSDPLVAGEHPVAMSGQVWVYADESNGPIRPGDRLTTSGATPGYAAKAADAARSNGAVLGKAMTAIEHDTGMVLVLVNLQ